MKKIVIVLMFLVPFTLLAQIQTSMFLSGDFNGWAATTMTYRALGASNWIVTINYTNTTASNGFKFRNSSSDWNTSWGKSSAVSLNSSTTWYSGGNNGTITLTQNMYYSFTFQDVSNTTNSQGFVMETSAIPVSITNVSDDIPTAISNSTDAIVTITLSAAKSTEENIYVRYTNDSWSTWTIVQATGSGTTYAATIPNAALQGGTPTDAYYVFTSTLSKTTLDAASGTDIDLATISYSNNGGTNFPLPVELTSFSASAVGNNVELNWATATEVNNYGFEVQRSVIGIQHSAVSVQRSAFEKIGFVEGHGNSNSPNNYSFTDNNVSYGKYAYRLKQIDTDGKYTYSKIVEVQAGQKPTAFALDQNYPNPFNPTTTITYKIAEQGFVNLKVYNILGQKVLSLVNQQQQPGVYHVRFNGSKLPSGVYIYRLEVKAKNNSFSALKKFVLLK